MTEILLLSILLLLAIVIRATRYGREKEDALRHVMGAVEALRSDEVKRLVEDSLEQEVSPSHYRIMQEGGELPPSVLGIPARVKDHIERMVLEVDPGKDSRPWWEEWALRLLPLAPTLLRLLKRAL